jgi:chloride channel protein, CIC family
VALGSGTSGGILAPLLICGAAAGGVIGHGFGGPTGVWALLGMAGTLAGVTRSPFTSIVFGVELTHQQTLLLPLLATCAVAHFVSALVLKRSILTEKVARRGFHVMREYAVDPLEALFVAEVMRTDIRVVPPHAAASGLRDQLERDTDARRQRLFPVVGDDLHLVGIVDWSHLKHAQDPQTVAALLRTDVIVAYPDEVLRTVATRMADHELGALPVIERNGSHAVLGIITEFELLSGRRRQLVEERHRERPFRLRPPRTPSRGHVPSSRIAPTRDAPGNER